MKKENARKRWNKVPYILRALYRAPSVLNVVLHAFTEYTVHSMQSHASRHVASEFLKDRHPDLSPPFPKVFYITVVVVRLRCNAPEDSRWSMQEVIKDEIAVAFGRRGVIKVWAFGRALREWDNALPMVGMKCMKVLKSHVPRNWAFDLSSPLLLPTFGHRPFPCPLFP